MYFQDFKVHKSLWRFLVGIIVVTGLPTIMALSCSESPDPGTSAYIDVIDHVRTGSRVDLDARGSLISVADRYIDYTWRLREKPEESEAVLSHRKNPFTSFIADVDGEYVVQLETYDGYTEEHVARRTIVATSGNAAPVAEAGAYQEVMVGSTVQLDAGASYDADDDALGYAWSFTGNKDEPLSDRYAVNPTFVANSITHYQLEVEANDGLGGSDSNIVSIYANTQNNDVRPMAIAGHDQYVTTGSVVELDGSGSYSPELSFNDYTALDYKWRLLYRPRGSEAALDNVSAVRPSFTADVEGAYVFILHVYDNGVRNRDTFDGINDSNVVVFAGNGNTPPRADGGPDFIVDQSEQITFDASGSSDAENAPLTYDWSIYKSPVGSSQSLTSNNEVTTGFTPDLQGTYLIRLVVNDGQDDSAPDIVRVVANLAGGSGTNLTPIADAGPDQDDATVGQEVTLDGTGSSDPENQSLTYSWVMLDQPLISSATLASATSANPTFTPDVAGEYTVRLTVNDGTQDSLPDSVTITASEAVLYTELTLMDTSLPYTPPEVETATLIEIDLSVTDTLVLNYGYGTNEPYVAMYAVSVTMSDAEFYTNDSHWTLISRSHANPVNQTGVPRFVVQRDSDGQYYDIVLDFTVIGGSAVVRIDNIRAWNCGMSQANCPP